MEFEKKNFSEQKMKRIFLLGCFVLTWSMLCLSIYLFPGLSPKNLKTVAGRSIQGKATSLYVMELQELKLENRVSKESPSYSLKFYLRDKKDSVQVKENLVPLIKLLRDEIDTFSKDRVLASVLEDPEFLSSLTSEMNRVFSNKEVILKKLAFFPTNTKIK